MELIRCPRCAKEVPAISQFCRRCGYTIAWNIATAPSPKVAPSQRPVARPIAVVPPRAAHRPAPPTPSKPRKSGVLGLLAILGAIFFFSNLSLRSKPYSPPKLNSYPYYSPSFKTTPTYSPPPYYVPKGNSMNVIPQYVPRPMVIPEPPRPPKPSYRPGSTDPYPSDQYYRYR